MKKILLFLCLIAAFASCSDDKVQEPEKGKLKLEVPELTVNSISADTQAEVKLTGVTGEPTATVDLSSREWCSAEVKMENSSKSVSGNVWVVAITAKQYTGNADQKGYITVRSGMDEVVLTVIQTGRAKSVRMVVVNEGQFTKGTAALSAITYDGTSTFDIFRDVNAKPLGDVAQSITYLNGQYFVVLNNSRQIKVIEPLTFKLTATIDYEEKPASPRFIAPLNDSMALVSDLQRQLTIVHTKNYKVLEYISLDGAGIMGIEKMTTVGKKVFCAAGGSGVKVFDTDNVISASTMRSVEGTVGGTMKTAKMILDKNNKLWVMTTGSGKTILNCINTDTEKVEKIVEIPYVKKGEDAYVNGCITGGNSFNRMDTDRSKGKLYFLMNMLVNPDKGTSINAIFTLDVDKNAIEPQAYRELPGLGMMYGMGISPDGDVFLCDCLDYTAQRGFLREYKADGNVISNRVGIYPRMVHFTEYDK